MQFFFIVKVCNHCTFVARLGHKAMYPHGLHVVGKNIFHRFRPMQASVYRDVIVEWLGGRWKVICSTLETRPICHAAAHGGVCLKARPNALIELDYFVARFINIVVSLIELRPWEREGGKMFTIERDVRRMGAQCISLWVTAKRFGDIFTATPLQ